MKNIDDNEVDKAAEFLEEVSQQEGSELGEYWNYISTIWLSYNYCFGSEFTKALKEEILEQARIASEEFELVTKEVVSKRTITQYERKVK